MKKILMILKKHWQGAIVGAILGLLLWIPQECFTDWRDTRSKRSHWSKSVVEEIRSNVNRGVNTPYLNSEGEHSIYLRYLANTSLISFLSEFPSLGIEKSVILDSSRSLLELTIVTNQLIDQRNTRKTTDKGGIVLVGVLKSLDTAIDSLVSQYGRSSAYLEQRLGK